MANTQKGYPNKNEKPIHICGLVLFEWMLNIQCTYGHEVSKQTSEVKKWLALNSWCTLFLF